MRGSHRTDMADGKETLDTKVHRVRRTCQGQRQHRRRHKYRQRRRLSQRHLLPRSNRHKCPVDLGRTRLVRHRHMELLHNRLHHRTQRELHRIHTHKLVDKAKRLETHGWDFQIGVWEKVNLIQTCPCPTKARDLRCNSTQLRRKIRYLRGTLKIQEPSLETILKSCSFGNVKETFRRGDKA